MRFILISLLSIFSFSANAADQSTAIRCTYFGGLKEKVCPASMISLATNHERFYGRTVAVSGYVKKVEGSLYVFTSKEFADNFSIADSVKIVGQTTFLDGKSDSWVTLIGVLKPLGSLDLNDDIFRPFATLEVKVTM
jgi:hypothetical protein